GPLRLGRQAAGLDELEASADSFLVDPPQKPSGGFGSDARPLGRDVEANLLASDTRSRRPDQRSCAGSGAVVVDREAQCDLDPTWIEAAFDGVPAIDERHGANRTLRPVAKVEQRSTLAKSELHDVLREMLLIRRFEEKVEERFRAGELPGFLDVAIGRGACAGGVCPALERGHTVAKGTHPNELMAELYGKQEGCSRGYGGSMHLYDVERGNMGANAVIGGGLPHITGAALAFQMRGEPRVAVAFFGDGAT